MDQKSRIFFYVNASKLWRDFDKKLDQLLGPIISGTKCNQQKKIFLQKEGVSKIELDIK